MAAEHDSDSVEPPGSEALLDAVLRTLYDLGERSSWEEAAKDSETHPEAAGPRPTWSPGAMSASAVPHLLADLLLSFSLCRKIKSEMVTKGRPLAEGQALAGRRAHVDCLTFRTRHVTNAVLFLFWNGCSKFQAHLHD